MQKSCRGDLLDSAQAILPAIVDEPHGAEDDENPDDRVEAMEVSAQCGPALAEFEASVG